MAKYIYPAIFAKDKDFYVVRFPDLDDCYTQGENIQEAYEMAVDVLCLMLYDKEENGVEIPTPSEINAIKAGENEFVSLVSCDTLEYREYYDNKAIKKTLTIPSWLNKMSEREGINFSAVLQNALKNEVHISER